MRLIARTLRRPLGQVCTEAQNGFGGSAPGSGVERATATSPDQALAFSLAAGHRLCRPTGELVRLTGVFRRMGR